MTDEQKNNQDGAQDQTQQQAKPKLTGKITGAASLGSENRTAIDYFREVAAQATTEEGDVNSALFVLLDYLGREARVNKLAEKGLSEQFFILGELLGELGELLPYIEAELLKPEYAGMTFADHAKQTETGETYFQRVIKNARDARDAGADPNQLPQISYNHGTIVKTMTDKFSNLFFSMAAPQPRGTINGQRQFLPVKYEKQGAKKEITLFYDYSYNEKVIERFGLSKDFDDLAFFTMSIIDNLYDEGNYIVSSTKIWHELGNTGSPSTEAITNLVNILRLGMSTIITADIKEIFDAWGIEAKNKDAEIISPVIPVQIIREKFSANGKTSNALIHIMGHSPFYMIGYPLKHLTDWNKDVLRLYSGRRTKRYYSVLRFLITNIGWMRNQKSNRSNKIRYSTLYNATGDKTTRDKQLTRKMLHRLLDEVFIPTGYVTAYKEATTGEAGVMIFYSEPPKLAEKK